jgi:hypothetical protein
MSPRPRPASSLASRRPLSVSPRTADRVMAWVIYAVAALAGVAKLCGVL